jgi:hypothetical protein
MILGVGADENPVPAALGVEPLSAICRSLAGLLRWSSAMYPFGAAGAHLNRGHIWRAHDQVPGFMSWHQYGARRRRLPLPGSATVS